ncbi:MAG: DNA polymerase III subunit alpha [Bradyrhizobiaceae bacterium]|nr:DNA polymerase III subunit alpha [Bradyrhizobiaceae bacterium]
MMTLGFVHLHLHSAYSLLEGALPLARLVELAAADRQPAVALTDTNNMFGALEFSAKMASAGIQPIIGCALSIDCGDQEPRRTGGGGAAAVMLPRLVLLAATEAGYRNLLRLNSRAYLDHAGTEPPHLKLDWLDGDSDGLIALTGGPDGPLDRALVSGQPQLVEPRAEALLRLFGDRLYVELQRHGTAEERLAEPALIDLAYARGIALVATNEPYFATADDYEAHDALLSIAEGRLLAETDRRHLTVEHHFKSRAEMTTLFADLPEALASTVEIAERSSFRPVARRPILPRFTTKEEAGTGRAVNEADELRRQAAAGLRRRIDTHGLAPGFTEAQYAERLDYELGVIEKMKFPGYFLIVADFIQWAKAQRIPVGPGRGSGAGSLVAYALTITDLDPIRFGLIFERFLNPERVSMPDFDVDFCQSRRDEVIQYVQGRYGRDRVAQIITHGSLQARGVLRDVGRVLEMPYGQVNKLCNLVPQNPAAPVTLSRAIEDEPRLQAERDNEPIVARAFAIAEKLEGLYRHASTHAAGIVIGDRRLDELVPLCRDPKSDMPVTQFNMKWVEQAGLVKFDFLGLKTLTVLETAVKLIAARGIEIDLSRIPLDDTPTFEMLARGETVGIFQVESQGMRRALVDMRPDRFEDLVVLVALYRPGPMANIPTYCARKLGQERTEYLHPKLQPILEPTFGIITYQEQVMKIAQDLAGYSLGEADLLRRAMGKKIRKEMEQQGERFVSGAVARGIAKADAQAIFEACAKFADYGFNKSHSAPYALLTYQTAYLKANYPVEFIAASMTLDMANTDKLAEFHAEARRMGIIVEPPSINRSGVEFEVAGNTIRYALAAVKGVGRAAIEAIVAVRERPFADLGDFAHRLNARAVNKRVLESLAAAGAFDELEAERARATAAIDAVMATAQRTQAAAASGQAELFGAADLPEPIKIPDVPGWLPAERLQREYDAVGFFLTGHPLDSYADILPSMQVQSWATFSRNVKAGANAGRVAATVVSRAERRTKSGNKMGIVGLSDPSGHYEAVLFFEALQQYRDLLEPGSLVLVQMTAEAQGDDIRARIQTVEPLDRAAGKVQKGLRIFVRDEASLDAVAKRLDGGEGRRQARSQGGEAEGEVNLIVTAAAGTEVELKLPGRYRVSPQFAGALKAIPGVIDVKAVQDGPAFQ